MKKKLILMAVMFLPNLAFAGVTYHLDIPGIPGESQRVDHEGEIDFESMSWGLTSDDRSSCIEDMKINKFIDLSSPELMLAQTTGRNFPEVTIAVRKDSGDIGFDYLTIVMTNVVINAISVEGSRAEGPVETVSMSFDVAQVEYIPQNDDGGMEEPVSVTLFPGTKCK